MNLILLLKLIKNNGPIYGRKRLQKLVFILKEKYHIPFEYNFVLHYFGPYSSELQEDISFLVDIGFIKEIEPTLSMGPYIYELTDEGRRICEEKTLGSSIEQRLIEGVTELSSLPTSTLVDLSYRLYSSR